MADQLPSKLEMAKSLAMTAKASFKKLLSEGKLFTDREIAQKRIAVCLDCEFLNEENRCSVCGCHVEAKVRIYASHCPKAKW